MAKIIDIGVEKDHIESLTRANGINALAELLWNSLDADASEVKIEYVPTELGNYEYIKVLDNGHGLTYEKAQDVFSRLGGSEKKNKTQSPSGRQFHGKEGKGRYKGLALGDLVKFTSVYQNNGAYSEFTITLDRNQLSRTEISDVRQLKKGEGKAGFAVEIGNVNFKNADYALKSENRKELEERFASYWTSYPKFKIFFNDIELQFASLIKNTEQTEVMVHLGDLSYKFIIKILEWNFENKKKTYLCNAQGIPFLETNLGVRSSIPISVFIQSVYIEKLHRENALDLYEANEILFGILKESKDFARDYVRRRLHEYSKEFINDLKKKGIYPYKEPAENIIEVSKRQVFDIVALQINEYLPSFNEQDDKNKKLTLKLISESLENDSKNLRRILSEVIELPKEQREDLAELLESTSLSSIIDAMTEIKNRLHFLNGLEQIIYDKDLNKNILERRHLHKIVINETWIFGDEYTYGVDDLTLKNVLKSYLKDCLKREDFESVVNAEDNSELETIPDVCLWQQFSLGTAGKENLVIELKRPSLDAGFDEKTQIESYATKVANDKRFPKSKTRWKFILITKDFKSEIVPLLTQKNRKYGHIHEGENFDVFILSWGDIISEAKQRHEFIKEKLNLNLQDNEEGLNYLKTKYKQYLPSEP
ncbi:ATP-binding protein [Dyadobacter sp. CY351]|uniref:ATP-binding protein n=1 Tax=Dyadobacter sp. CY351 TaxID=2909337 RepID=UPI001F47E795|nr:ATP-binding protein [Dyadobacter sp. CY351]MCF2517776.1 ATP-binding protein [Dyadobacter sp. CY351]